MGNGHRVNHNSFKSNSKMTSASVLDGFTITGNNVQISASGAGIYNSHASPTFRNLIITRNRTTGNGGGIYNSWSSPILINVLIVNNNSTSNAGAIFNSAYSSPVFVNVTISNNIGGNGNSNVIRNASYSSPVFQNTIVYGNTPPTITNSSSTPQYFYSLVQGVTTEDANNNLDGNLNPLFVDVSQSNYELLGNSPIVNKGNNNFISETFDLKGNQRVSEDIVDLGSYESQSEYSGPSTIYVNQNADGNNDGSSWADAYTDLQQAINNSLFGDTIWVAAGTYQPAFGTSFSMKEGVEIYGGFPNNDSNAELEDRNWVQNQTILLGNGNNVVRNVFTSSAQMTSISVLDGFTITGNNIQISASGAGIYNEYASPTLRNLNLRNNRTTGNGGAIFNNQSSPTITNAIIFDNSAGFGGAFFNQASSPVITNVSIVSNTALSSAGASSAFRNVTSSNPILRNSVIWN